MFPREDNLIGPAAVLQIMQFFTRGGVHDLHGCIDPQGYIDPVARGHEAAGQHGRSAFQGPEVVHPVLDILFPENRAVKGIPRDQFPA